MSCQIVETTVDRAAHAVSVVFGRGEERHASGVLALVEAHVEDGHLLPRTLDEIRRHVDRFVVVTHQDRVVGCAELAPLSRAVAEVRSLVVDGAWRGRGLGTALITELRDQARRAGFSTVCAFTHDPSRFVRLGFSIVPHVWFPEKIALDCTGCSKFRRCGQRAVALPIGTAALAAPGTSHLRLPLTMATLPPVGDAPVSRRRAVKVLGA